MHFDGMSSAPTAVSNNPRVVGRIGGLFVHPVKSTAPIAVDELWLDELGAIGDRRWMLIDDNGEAITAREHSRLALVQCRYTERVDDARIVRNTDGPLWLSAIGFEDLAVSIPIERVTQRSVIWGDTVEVVDAGDVPAEWFSDVIGASCRLVRIASNAVRPLQSRFAGPVSATHRRVALSDGAPLLLLGQSTIDALNVRIRAIQTGQSYTPMVVQRFRPNILIVDSDAHAEDTWHSIHIGTVVIGVGDACKRCVFTTVDPGTGARGLEPLHTLATYRRHEGHVLFAMNATHTAPGVIRIGDDVKSV